MYHSLQVNGIWVQRKIAMQKRVASIAHLHSCQEVLHIWMLAKCSLEIIKHDILKMVRRQLYQKNFIQVTSLPVK
ncbi:hypothetical protein D3C75_922900 [compost metagenome]